MKIGRNVDIDIDSELKAFYIRIVEEKISSITFKAHIGFRVSERKQLQQKISIWTSGNL